MSARLSWVLIALSGLALLAGCGQSEKQKYTSKMKSISGQLQKDEQQISGANPAASPSEKATRAVQLQTVLNRLAQRYAAVKPPAKVKELHQRLTVIVRAFADSLTPYIQAAKSGDTKGSQGVAKALNTQAVAFQAQIKSLNSEYKSKGYKLT